MVAMEGELPGLNPAVDCHQTRHRSTTMNGGLHRRNLECSGLLWRPQPESEPHGNLGPHF
jgi:hypothetical protein